MRLIQTIPIIVIIFFASGVGAVPVEEWNRTYPDLGWGISDIAPSVDGGYVLAACDSIVKIDASGKRQWIRELSNPKTASREYSTILHVGSTEDGGYIFGGSRSFIGDFGSKSISAVIKTDAEGIEQWNRTFNENIDKFREIGGGINSIQQTNEGGYILAESTIYVDTNDARIIKLDSGGNTEWTRTFDNSLRPSIRQTLDGGYILSIYHGNFRERYRETILKKLDAKGNDIWNLTYPKMDNGQVELTADGMYMISGEKNSKLTNIDAFLIKIDANGNELWNKTYGGTVDDGFGVIQKTLDGGYILAGYTGADHNTDVLPYFLGDAWLVRVDAD
jgi:hypothetical protein